MIGGFSARNTTLSVHESIAAEQSSWDSSAEWTPRGLPAAVVAETLAEWTLHWAAGATSDVYHRSPAPSLSLRRGQRV
jgi:hypothetical protein